MKALVLNKEGSYPSYMETDFSTHEAEVEVAVSAAALNHRDVWISKGMYPGIKVPCILGSDGVGEYQGRKVIINPGMSWGDNKQVQDKAFSILGMPKDGTFAERVSVEEKYIYDLPSHLSDTEGAALPLAGVTAYRALVTKCKPRKGETVLITGIGGGVALFAMQYALAIGCRVFVSSSSPQKIERAIEMGCEGGVLYTQEDWHKELLKLSGGIDVIIDGAGGEGFSRFPSIANPGGRIAFYGGTRGKIPSLSPQIIFWKQLSLMGSTMGSDQDFLDMVNFVNRHQIKPIVDKVYPMSEAREAFERMDQGGQFGKIVIDINL